jgi:glycerophosphoryl diester phosphodiesterase
MSAIRHPFLGRPEDGPLAIVHRGGALEADENTAEAFAAAVVAGHTYLETDVRATADGVLVAFHDRTLDRVTDRRGPVSELPWSEVARARVGGRAAVPRLDDLLSAFPDVRFNLDAKHDAVVRPLAALLRGRGLLERVCVASFSDRRLAWLRTALGPGACTALGPREVARLKRAAVLGRPTRLAPTALAVQVPEGPAALRLVDGRFVAAAHRQGLVVHVWTVDDPVAMDRLLDLGVDGLMTDRPSVLRAVLARRAAEGAGPGSDPSP